MPVEAGDFERPARFEPRPREQERAAVLERLARLDQDAERGGVDEGHHAEINALAGLDSSRRYEGYTLLSALEPCHLCLSAAIAVRVGRVRYAAPDPYAGSVGLLLPSADHLAHPVEIDGPLDGPRGRLPELLHVAHFLWRVPDGGVATFYRERSPDLLEAARALPAPDSGATLADAFAAL